MILTSFLTGCLFVRGTLSTHLIPIPGFLSEFLKPITKDQRREQRSFMDDRTNTVASTVRSHAGSNPGERNYVPRQEDISKLISMGFERDNAIAALIASSGNFNAALEILLSN